MHEFIFDSSCGFQQSNYLFIRKELQNQKYLLSPAAARAKNGRSGHFRHTQDVKSFISSISSPADDCEKERHRKRKGRTFTKAELRLVRYIDKLNGFIIPITSVDREGPK